MRSNKNICLKMVLHHGLMGGSRAIPDGKIFPTDTCSRSEVDNRKIQTNVGFRDLCTFPRNEHFGLNVGCLVIN